jgi:hypothetical protein
MLCLANVGPNPVGTKTPPEGTPLAATPLCGLTYEPLSKPKPRLKVPRLRLSRLRPELRTYLSSASPAMVTNRIMLTNAFVVKKAAFKRDRSSDFTRLC